MDMFKLLVSLIVLALSSFVWKLFNNLVWRPYVLTKSFGKQGISGPSYTFLSGSVQEIKILNNLARKHTLDHNSDNIIPRVLPHYYHWSLLHGEMFLYWLGSDPRLCITEPELAKEVLFTKSGFYPKARARASFLAILGQGLIFADGSVWERHRRILNPAFALDKIKAMTKGMAACTLSKLNEWQEQVKQGNNKEIEMCEEFQELTLHIIAHNGFGSSFLEAKEVFQVQSELMKKAAESFNDIYIPGAQYIPTRWNVQTWKLKARLKNILVKIVEGRMASGDGDSNLGFGDNLLGLMLRMSSMAEKQGDQKLNMDEIIDECKTFFVAGFETTSVLLTWTMFLLSIHREWQEKLRKEVLRECGTEIPDADKLSKLKMVNMVLLETLRLYPPVTGIMRMASRDVRLGNVLIPKGTQISIPIAMMQRKKEYWGENANEFNPLRFADGVASAANHPNAQLPFSIGPRSCIGQNFAMTEAKTVIAMILQQFKFSLSPQYKHAPIASITLQPQFGLPIILQPLHK